MVGLNVDRLVRIWRLAAGVVVVAGMMMCTAVRMTRITGTDTSPPMEEVECGRIIGHMLHSDDGHLPSSLSILLPLPSCYLSPLLSPLVVLLLLSRFHALPSRAGTDILSSVLSVFSAWFFTLLSGPFHLILISLKRTISSLSLFSYCFFFLSFPYLLSSLLLYSRVLNPHSSHPVIPLAAVPWHKWWLGLSIPLSTSRTLLVSPNLRLSLPPHYPNLTGSFGSCFSFFHALFSVSFPARARIFFF